MHIQHIIYPIDVKPIYNIFLWFFNEVKYGNVREWVVFIKVKRETICEDTLYIIREYYKLNIDPFLSVLSKDCVWLSIGNLLAFGAEAVKAQFKGGKFYE